MKTLINEYVESKQNAWAASTLKSERARLLGLSEALTGDPEALMVATAALKPYSRLTAFIRAAAFWDHLIAEGKRSGPNPYTCFRRRNAKLFKHAYKRKEVTLSYDEAKARIEAIKDSGIKRRAIEILVSGARWMESEQAGAEVVGKGGKTRRLYRPHIEGEAFGRSYSTFLRRLKKEAGLTPHDLRKLSATRLVEKGINEADLLRVMGWQCMATAAIYLQPKKEEELARLVLAP